MRGSTTRDSRPRSCWLGTGPGLELFARRPVLGLRHDVHADDLTPCGEEPPGDRAGGARTDRRRSTRVTGRTQGLVLVKNASSAV
jgi:hypothetical protein